MKYFSILLLAIFLLVSCDMPNSTPPSSTTISTYGICYTFRIHLPHLTSRWQVPSNCFHSYSLLRQITTWAVTLGPGTITRNPYSSMWIIPIVICTYPNLIYGFMVGFFHGLGRATNILLIAHRMNGGEDLWESLLKGNSNANTFNYVSTIILAFLFATTYIISAF